jgi:hypothetical protein
VLDHLKPMLSLPIKRTMSRSVLTVLVVAGLALAPAGAPAKPAAHPNLWATVNRCDTPSKPGAVGVRVSIPRERGAPRQWARIRLQWFDGGKLAWRLVRSSGGDAGWARFGIGTRVVQGGTTFTFPPPKPGARIVLRGLVDVEWRVGTRVVDRARMTTTAGHRDGNDPQRRVSRSSCEITR